MNTLPFSFLGEGDFLPAMEGPCRKWRESSVSEGYFKSFDGARLHYYQAAPENPRACIVIVHGFCEFFGKYHELAWYFYQAGYAVFFIEHRGHGYSERSVPEPDLVDIEDYRIYVEDLHEFMERIVVPGSGGLKRILYAHSMGGGISAYFLEEYPEYFSYAILNSPMFKKKVDMTPDEFRELKEEMKETHAEKELAPGQKHFDPVPSFETSSAGSKVRFDYVFSQRLADVHYQTRGATKEWYVASVELQDTLMNGAGRLRTPMTVFTAGKDALIDPAGYESFKERVGDRCTFIHFEESKHELFSAKETVRKEYLSGLFELLENVTQDA